MQEAVLREACLSPRSERFSAGGGYFTTIEEAIQSVEHSVKGIGFLKSNRRVRARRTTDVHLTDARSACFDRYSIEFPSVETPIDSPLLTLS